MADAGATCSATDAGAAYTAEANATHATPGADVTFPSILWQDLARCTSPPAQVPQSLHELL